MKFTVDISGMKYYVDVSNVSCIRDIKQKVRIVCPGLQKTHFFLKSTLIGNRIPSSMRVENIHNNKYFKRPEIDTLCPERYILYFEKKQPRYECTVQ